MAAGLIFFCLKGAKTQNILIWFPNTNLTLVPFVFSLWITNATANEFEKGGQKGIDTYLSRLKWYKW